MPTSNPRVNVTLSPALDLLVSRLAEHQRMSKSQVLRELLEAAEPALQRAVTLMSAASHASREVKSGLASALDAGLTRIEGDLEDQLARIDGFGDDLVTMVERVKGRAPARSAARPGARPQAVETPVPLTGGLGHQNQEDEKPGKGRRKPVVPDVPYTALHPQTGERVVLAGGQYFDRQGVLRAVRQGASRGRV